MRSESEEFRAMYRVLDAARAGLLDARRQLAALRTERKMQEARQKQIAWWRRNAELHRSWLQDADDRIADARVALSDAGIPEVVPVIEEAPSAGGLAMSVADRIRRLTAERDIAMAGRDAARADRDAFRDLLTRSRRFVDELATDAPDTEAAVLLDEIDDNLAARASGAEARESLAGMGIDVDGEFKRMLSGLRTREDGSTRATVAAPRPDGDPCASCRDVADRCLERPCDCVCHGRSERKPATPDGGLLAPVLARIDELERKTGFLDQRVEKIEREFTFEKLMKVTRG